MPRWAEKKLKYNPGEKSLKALNVIHLDLECLLKKLQYNNNNNNNNNIEESYTEKKLDMGLVVGQCLQDLHLIKKKIHLITIEEKLEKSRQ